MNRRHALFEYKVPDHLTGISDIEQMRQADLANLDEELRLRGSSVEQKIAENKIWRMKFPGVVLDLTGVLPVIDDDAGPTQGKYFIVTPIHPHRADLAFKRDITLERNPNVVTVTALLQNSSNTYTLGIRGGNVAAGKIAAIPGGHAEFRLDMPRAEDHLLEEFKEELGYDCKDPVKLIDAFPNRDTNGTNILYHIPVSLTTEELQERWSKAKDRDEHSGLLSITRDNLIRLSRDGSIKLGSSKYETTPFFQDCFKHYLENSWE